MGDDSKKITCKICYTPTNIQHNVVKMKCMCDDEIRTIPLDRVNDFEYSHIIFLQNEENNIFFQN